MSPTVFGKTDKGETVHRLTVNYGGLTASIMTWGATLQDLRLDGHAEPLVLGFRGFDDYPAHSPYFGATVGRFANRIAGAQFDVDGKRYNTDANSLNRHTLHGGAGGYGRRIWKIGDYTNRSVALHLQDPHGSMGFPGTVDCVCLYELHDNGTLRITLEAQSDQPTPINLSHHSYFNLDGSPDCLNHQLEIKASDYLPVDEELIPVGGPVSVNGTAFDFQTAKPIGRDLENAVSYDHNFCLAKQRRTLTKVARLHSALSGIYMDLSTTEPGLQIYSGGKIDTPVTGLGGKSYGPYSGLALEAQLWPDAPNRQNFPNAIIRPGDVSRQVSEYRFARLPHPPPLDPNL